MPTMSVLSSSSSCSLTDSETLVTSSPAGVGGLDHNSLDAKCSADALVGFLSWLDSSSGVCSCGSFRVDDSDDVVPSGLDTEAAIGTLKVKYGLDDVCSFPTDAIR